MRAKKIILFRYIFYCELSKHLRRRAKKATRQAQEQKRIYMAKLTKALSKLK